MARRGTKAKNNLGPARNWAQAHKFRYPQAKRQLDKRLPERFDRALYAEDSAGSLYKRLKRNKRIGKFAAGGKKPGSF